MEGGGGEESMGKKERRRKEGKKFGDVGCGCVVEGDFFVLFVFLFFLFFFVFVVFLLCFFFCGKERSCLAKRFFHIQKLSVLILYKVTFFFFGIFFFLFSFSL